jgi:predicted ABC-type ATPase
MGEMDTPTLLILGGCNGAGKSTSAVTLVPPEVPFLNADELAKALPDAQGKHVQAGRQWFEQWDETVADRLDFAIETTLASRTLAGRIRDVQAVEYRVHIVYFWLPDVELAVERVAYRVRRGGHNIPEEVIRRRYLKGWQNFLKIYRPLADKWHVYNNAIFGRSTLIASSEERGLTEITDAEQWTMFEGVFDE